MRHGVHISRSLARRLQADSTAPAGDLTEDAPQRRQSLKTRLRIRMAQLATEARQLPAGERSLFIAYSQGLIAQIPKD
jgi:hypothetical protein